MTELRQRMMDAMLVRGLSARTQECYIEAVARMARHYHKSPDLLSPAQVEAYLLHLVKDRQLSYSSVNHAASASRFLFEKVLGRSSDSALRPPMAKVPQKQPELLSREQITRLFACCTHPVHRMALQTLYATGLRVSEVCALRVNDRRTCPAHTLPTNRSIGGRHDGMRVWSGLWGNAPQGCGGKAAPPASQRMCSMPGGWRWQSVGAVFLQLAHPVAHGAALHSAIIIQHDGVRSFQSPCRHRP